VRTARPRLELSAVRGALPPALPAIRPRLRDARGPFPLQVRARAGPVDRTRVLGSADTGTLPSPKRPDLPDDTGQKTGATGIPKTHALTHVSADGGSGFG